MCIGVSAVRSVQKFNSALGILSKVDFRGNAPRSLAKNFSRSRSYLVSIKYDLNSYSSKAPDSVNYGGFFRRSRAPHYTPSRCAFYPLAKKHLIGVAYDISSPFGWGHSDEFTFFKYKKVKRGLLFFARSYGFANFVSFRKSNRKFPHPVRRHYHAHKKNFSVLRTILRRFRPFVQALRFKTWFNSFRSGLLRFSLLSQYVKIQKSFFFNFRRSRFFSRAHSRTAKTFFFRKSFTQIRAKGLCQQLRPSYLRRLRYSSFSSSVRLHLFRTIFDRSFSFARYFPKFQKRSRLAASNFVARPKITGFRQIVHSKKFLVHSVFSYSKTSGPVTSEQKLFCKFYGLSNLFFFSFYGRFYSNWFKFYTFGPILSLPYFAPKFFSFFYKFFYPKNFSYYVRKNRRNKKNFRFYRKLKRYVKFLFKRGFRGLSHSPLRLKKAFRSAIVANFFQCNLSARVIVPVFWALNSTFAGIRTPVHYFFNFRLYIPHYVPTTTGRFGLSSHQRYNTILFK